MTSLLASLYWSFILKEGEGGGGEVEREGGGACKAGRGEGKETV